MCIYIYIYVYILGGKTKKAAEIRPPLPALPNRLLRQTPELMLK